MKKALVVGLILVLIGASIVSGFNTNSTNNSKPVERGNWIYVGGNGPGNYTTIQSAINASNPGDTVFVYSGIYNEQLVIRVAISLIGESRNKTVIDTENPDADTLISIASNNITVSEFTLRFNGDWGGSRTIIGEYEHIIQQRYNITITKNIIQANISRGIWFASTTSFFTITHNIFYSNSPPCIQLWDTDNCVIANNSLNGKNERIEDGISLYRVIDSSITNNTFNSAEIFLGYSERVTISNNYFFNNSYIAIKFMDWAEGVSIISNHIDNPIRMDMNEDWGMGIWIQSECHNTMILRNFISHCKIGILLEGISNEMFVSMNTFKENIIHARFCNTFSPSHWDQNYWGRPRILPKPIFGVRNINNPYPGFVEFDWHPAILPYEISGMS